MYSLQFFFLLVFLWTRLVQTLLFCLLRRIIWSEHCSGILHTFTEQTWCSQASSVGSIDRFSWNVQQVARSIHLSLYMVSLLRCPFCGSRNQLRCWGTYITELAVSNGHFLCFSSMIRLYNFIITKMLQNLACILY